MKQAGSLVAPDRLRFDFVHFQPVTRQEVESMRGADSAGLLRQLVRLGLIVVQRGHGDKPEVCYGTTAKFLKLFQLRSLGQQPPQVLPMRHHDLGFGHAPHSPTDARR